MEREIILNFLKENQPFRYTVAKIKEKNESLKNIPSQKITSLLNQLVGEGEIYRARIRKEPYNYYYSIAEKEGFKKKKSILSGTINNYSIHSFKMDKDNFVVISEKEIDEPKIFKAYDEFDAIVKYVFKYTDKKSVARNDFEYHRVSKINFSYEI